MSPVRIAILGGALVASLGAAFLVRGIATGREAKPVAVVVVPPNPTVRVMVAARDLAVGDCLTVQDMTWQPWPQSGVNSDYVTIGAPVVAPVSETGKLASAASGMAAAVSGADRAPMEVWVGATVREPIHKSEPIIAAKVVRAGDAGVLAVKLTPGQRAMAVPLTAESAAGGFILPGDHVDVVQTRQLDGGGAKGFVSSTVLNNVRVLAIDQKLDQKSDADKTAAAVVGATATLEVSPRQAEVLAVSKGQGQLTLVLRSYADIEGPATIGVVQSASIAGSGAAPRNPVVRVFRNGGASDVAVAQ